MRFRWIWLRFFPGMVSFCLFLGQAHSTTSFDIHLVSLRSLLDKYRSFVDCIVENLPNQDYCEPPEDTEGVIQLIVSDLSSTSLGNSDYFRLIGQLNLVLTDLYVLTSRLVQFRVDDQIFTPAATNLKRLIGALDLARQRLDINLQNRISDLQNENAVLRDAVKSWRQFLERKKRARYEGLKTESQPAPEVCNYYAIQANLRERFLSPEPLLDDLLKTAGGIGRLRTYVRSIDFILMPDLSLPGNSPRFYLSALELVDLSLDLISQLDDKAATLHRKELVEMDETIRVRNELVQECNDLKRRLQKPNQNK